MKSLISGLKCQKSFKQPIFNFLNLNFVTYLNNEKIFLNVLKDVKRKMF